MAMQNTMNVGGQAVIEGVMMRAPGSMTVAVRKPSGEIALKREPIAPLGERWRFLRWPVVRGTVTLFSALALGFRALNFSANCQLEEDGAGAAGGDAAAGGCAVTAGNGPGGEKREIGGLMMGATMALSVVLGLFLFFYLPLYLTQMLDGLLPATKSSSIAFNLVDGVIRIVFFLAYILAITRIKDIRRVFEYHGAEHKAIYAYEAGAELTVENTRGYPKLHPRCGTSFLLIVMVMSIMVFSFVPKDAPFYMKALSRLVLIPVIAGLSYEFIKFSAKKRDNRIISALVMPGLWLQRLTTREPDDGQLEVAIRALKEALAMEHAAKHEGKEVAPCLEG